MITQFLILQKLYLTKQIMIDLLTESVENELNIYLDEMLGKEKNEVDFDPFDGKNEKLVIFRLFNEVFI